MKLLAAGTHAQAGAASSPRSAAAPRARECFAAGYASIKLGVRVLRTELERSAATRTLAKAQGLAQRAERKLSQLDHR